MSPEHDPVVIHASVRGWLAAAVSPTSLIVIGGVALGNVGPRPIPVAVFAFGLVLGLVVAFDFPRHTRFDPDGVVRVCLLRRHRLPWTDLVAIERTRPTTMAMVRRFTERDRSERVGSGGLIARGRGRRTWLLTDNLEGRSEHDALDELLRVHELPVAMRAERPPEHSPPTDLYRRRRSRGSSS